MYPYSKDNTVTNEFLKDVFDMILKYLNKTFDRRSKLLDFHYPHQLKDGIEGKYSAVLPIAFTNYSSLLHSSHYQRFVIYAYKDLSAPINRKVQC